MNSKGKCEFCYSENSPLRIPSGEKIHSDLFVCNSCWSLLQKPETALPLIRGHITMTLRGTINENELHKMMEGFMSSVSLWKKKIKN